MSALFVTKSDSQQRASAASNWTDSDSRLVSQVALLTIAYRSRELFRPRITKIDHDFLLISSLIRAKASSNARTALTELQKKSERHQQLKHLLLLLPLQELLHRYQQHSCSIHTVTCASCYYLDCTVINYLVSASAHCAFKIMALLSLRAWQ
jgi:hypothetical protein